MLFPFLFISLTAVVCIAASFSGLVLLFFLLSCIIYLEILLSILQMLLKKGVL